MKAIHNGWCLFRRQFQAVNYTQRYKKWKQFTTVSDLSYSTNCCELYTKIQKMKAIHNRFLPPGVEGIAVNYTQRYKKWKQFTTCSLSILPLPVLWTIHKDTKNESNSQHFLKYADKYTRCELYTKIQKMKAIHNTSAYGHDLHAAVNYTQRYKKWKQFTTDREELEEYLKLWTIHKDTKNESNSQREQPIQRFELCCELYTKIQKMKAIHN